MFGGYSSSGKPACVRLIDLSILYLSLLFLLCDASNFDGSWSGDTLTDAVDCPTWYFAERNTTGSTHCKCGSRLGELVRCKDSTMEVAILNGFCLTYSESRQETVVGYCPYNSFNNFTNRGFTTLTQNVSSLNSFMCGSLHRDGQLCGRCQAGHAPALSSFVLQRHCVKSCSSRAGNQMLLFFTVQFVPVTIFFFIVVIFQMNAASGPLNAFVFFSQMASLSTDIFYYLGFANKLGTGSYVFVKIILSVYGIWNLDFFRLFLPAFCMKEGTTALQVLAMEYITPVYLLFLTVAMYVCIELHARDFKLIVLVWKPFHRCFVRFRRSWNLRSSIVDAFATFLLLSYSKLAFVSIRILMYSVTYTMSGAAAGSRVFFDGTMEYLGKRHIPYAILAFFLSISIAFVALFLTVYQVRMVQRLLNCSGSHCQGFRMFIEVFQGCYKDGTKGRRDLRFFAGLYFVLRLLVAAFQSALYAFGVYGSAMVLAINLTYVVAALGFALLQPYRKMVYNVVDTFFFGIGSLQYALILYGGVVSFGTVGMSHTQLGLIRVELFLILPLPLIYASVLIVYALCTQVTCMRGCLPISRKDQHRTHGGVRTSRGSLLAECPELDATESMDCSLPDRVLKPAMYQSLHLSDYVTSN